MEIQKYLDAFEITEEDLKSKKRDLDISLIRHVVWHHLRKTYTLMQIGEYFNRCHGTIYTGVKQIQDLLEIKDKEVLEMVEKIKAL